MTTCFECDTELSGPICLRCNPLAQSWQPIETAPKDGTQIIIAVAGDEYEPSWAWWSDRHRAWFIPHTSIAYQMEPTHWMPLPPPPEAKD